VIPDNVTSIGNNAFAGCNHFNGSLNLSSTLLTIGDNAFYGCFRLTGNLNIPNTVTSIGAYAFNGCYGFASNINITSSVSTIGDYAFAECSNVQRINIERSSPATIGTYSFDDTNDCPIYVPAGCANVYKSNWLPYAHRIVELPDNFKMQYTSISGNVIAPNISGIHTFGANLLSNTISSYNGTLTFDNEAQCIGDYAFDGKSDLSALQCANTYISSFGKHSFDGTSLSQLPNCKYDRLVVIDEYAFNDCSSLTNTAKIFNANNTAIREIGDYAFANCTSAYVANGGLTIPDSVNSLGRFAFLDDYKFTGKLKLSKNIIRINEGTFSGCYGLTHNIEIPNTVVSVDDNAFYSCSYFDRAAFISSSINSIGADSFNGCSKLSYIIVDGSTPATLGNNAFDNTNECPILVPAPALSRYTNAWNNYAHRIISLPETEQGMIKYTTTNDNNVKIVSNNAFSANVTANNVTNDGNGVIYFDDDISYIGHYAFSTGMIGTQTHADNLRTIDIPYGVSYIGNYAFYDCDTLTDIILPASITSIGERAFYDCDIKRIYIPNSVNNIGEGAFMFTSFSYISIPGSVTTIGDSAFSRNSNLLSVRLSNGITTIPSECFYNDTKLSYVDINNECNVTIIGNSAFEGCTNLENITLPPKLQRLNSSCFARCESLKRIDLPNSFVSGSPVYEAFGRYVFRKCKNLEAFGGIYPGIYKVNDIGRCIIINGEVREFAPKGLTSFEIPSTHNYYPVTGIDKYVFEDSPELETLTLPDSINVINDDAFHLTPNLRAFLGTNQYISSDNRCVIINGTLRAFAQHGLTNYNIPNNVTTIGDYVFHDCDSLTTINIPNSLTSIGRYAFYHCDGLTSITIPNSVTSIAEGAFYYCSQMTSITLSTGLTVIPSDMCHMCSSLSSLVIPNSITTINASAFESCSNLVSVEIPNSVTTIVTNPFKSCSKLAQITGTHTGIDNNIALIINNSLVTFAIGCNATTYTIPSSVTTISGYAFFNNTLTNVIMPAGLQTIKGFAFGYGRNLTSVTIPSSVTTIESYAFYGCSGLTSITCENINPPSLGSSAFGNTNCPIYVPAGSVDTYKSATGWSTYKSRIFAIGS